MEVLKIPAISLTMWNGDLMVIPGRVWQKLQVSGQTGILFRRGQDVLHLNMTVEEMHPRIGFRRIRPLLPVWKILSMAAEVVHAHLREQAFPVLPVTIMGRRPIRMTTISPLISIRPV